MKDDRLLTKGNFYPLMDSGFKSAARRAAARPGLKDSRFHGSRHTAATRLLR
jgi:integrase